MFTPKTIYYEKEILNYRLKNKKSEILKYLEKRK